MVLQYFYETKLNTHDHIPQLHKDINIANEM